MLKIKSEYPDIDKYKSLEDIYYYKKDTDIIHNPYGAAVICKSGYKAYWIEGKLHRLDGPARIWENCNYKEEYWIYYEYLTKEQFEKHPERLKFVGKEYLICLK